MTFNLLLTGQNTNCWQPVLRIETDEGFAFHEQIEERRQSYFRFSWKIRLSNEIRALIGYEDYVDVTLYAGTCIKQRNRIFRRNPIRFPLARSRAQLRDVLPFICFLVRIILSIYFNLLGVMKC